MWFRLHSKVYQIVVFWVYVAFWCLKGFLIFSGRNQKGALEKSWWINFRKSRNSEKNVFSHVQSCYFWAISAVRHSHKIESTFCMKKNRKQTDPFLSRNLLVICSLDITSVLQNSYIYFNFFPFLNPQSGYIKIDAYLLILCHVISDVKLSYYFLL